MRRFFFSFFVRSLDLFLFFLFFLFFLTLQKKKSNKNHKSSSGRDRRGGLRPRLFARHAPEARVGGARRGRGVPRLRPAAAGVTADGKGPRGRRLFEEIPPRAARGVPDRGGSGVPGDGAQVPRRKGDPEHAADGRRVLTLFFVLLFSPFVTKKMKIEELETRKIKKHSFPLFFLLSYRFLSFFFLSLSDSYRNCPSLTTKK